MLNQHAFTVYTAAKAADAQCCHLVTRSVQELKYMEELDIKHL